MVLYETVATTCDMFAVGTVITLLFGFHIYTEACLLDIQSLFSQADCLSKSRNCELALLDRCTQAVTLHGRLNRYLLWSENVCSSKRHSLLMFQVHAWLGWSYEYNFLGFDSAIDDHHMHFIVHNGVGRHSNGGLHFLWSIHIFYVLFWIL